MLATADVRPPTPRVQTRRESEESIDASVSPSGRAAGRGLELPRSLPPGFEAQMMPAPLVSPSLTMSMTPRGGHPEPGELPQGDAAGGRRFTFSEGGAASAAQMPPAGPQQQESMRLLSQPAAQRQPFPHVPVTAAFMVITAGLAVILPLIMATLGAVLAFSSGQCAPWLRARIPFRTYGRGVFAISFLLELAQIVGILLLAFLPESKMYKGTRMRVLFVSLASIIFFFLASIILYLYGIALLVRAQNTGNACPAGAKNTATGIVVLGMIFTPVIFLCLGVLLFERHNVKLILSILTMTAGPLFSPTNARNQPGYVTKGPALRATPSLAQHYQQPQPSPVSAAAKAAADAHYASYVSGSVSPHPPPLPPRASPPGQSPMTADTAAEKGIALSRPPSFRRSVSGKGTSSSLSYGSGAPIGPIGGGRPILPPSSGSGSGVGGGGEGSSGLLSSKGFTSFEEEEEGGGEEGKQGLLGSSKKRHDDKDLLSFTSQHQQEGGQGEASLPSAATLDPSPTSARKE
jgi:uncharacterized membrane protein YgcG